MPSTQLPSVRQLRYFATLEVEQHFGRAAEACHVSQPAFSVAIRELEERLGLQLVDRNSRRVAITPAGREIAAQARLCLRDLEQLCELATARREPMAGPLTIGVIPTIAPFLLPRVLPQTRRRFPHLQLFIREAQSEELLNQLEDGQLDVVLLALPYPMRNVTSMQLFKDPFLLAYRRGTKLIDPDGFSVNRITADTVLLLEEGHCLRDHAMAACKVRNLAPVNPFAATSLFTLLEMVDSDLGVTFLPQMAVGSALLRQTHIQTAALPRGGHRDIALIWRKSSGRQKEFRQLGQLIRDTAGANAQ
ncbi:MAG: LysR substrate-binding domain-containing protein [Gammaproteobacteria bacterium]|nr:LysR substrate-binding domain-containing protein [Gammaproteobacteria bacterium]